METATLSGVIQDPKGTVVPDVEVTATRIETGTAVTTKTNGAGIYFFTGLMPGHYHLTVRKPGFKEIAIKEFQLNVQDKLEQNFALEIGSVSETVTVNANDLKINTTDATVSTVVDRQFAENLPMNGRSFQTLIQLTPGVVVTPSTNFDSGQFSVNGQRASSNYFMVDGVSANIGVGVNNIGAVGNALGGALGSFSVQGGTNSLVSVDALQEFRIQTSTYAPEFGRSPGAQISILTRSGTNQFHGTLFDYLRNDALDASDWFNGTTTPPLPKAKDRQNDFGGTLSGPLFRDKTFFFFSYEGLRLRLPQTVLSKVPDLTARQNALLALQPFLNAFPLPNGPDNLATGVAQFNASFSNRSTLDAYSLRIDHRLSTKLSLFARYNYSPSESDQRGNGPALSTLVPTRITTQTATAGATWTLLPTTVNDLRFNYSRVSAISRYVQDTFGGGVPLATLPLPSPFTSSDAFFDFVVFSLSPSFSPVGINGGNLQRQINVVDNLSLQKGSHSLKFGADFRRLSPHQNARQYTQGALFRNVSSAENGNLFLGILLSGSNADLLFNNLGIFAQDTWRVVPRLTVTYGLRWDVDFAPSSDPGLLSVTGFNVNDLSKLALAPAGTPVFGTTYGNFAPRVGVAYQISQSQNWQTVIRGGFGVFFDLADQEVGNLISQNGFPFLAQHLQFGGTFPLSPANAAPPPMTLPGGGSGNINAFDPNLKLPYTLQWNIAVEQSLGMRQTLSGSYIGSVGRRLIQSSSVSQPNSNFAKALLVGNSATSDYDALQVQFQRRVAQGLQALASYTWSHSIDTASAGSFGSGSNLLVLGSNRNANRGPSDFDIRNAFTVGVTYDIPASKINRFTNAILHGWSVQTILQSHSAPPVDLFDSQFPQVQSSQTNVRPDIVPGQPFYLFGQQYPGGKAFNPAAFMDPPIDPNTGNPLRQGNVPRNFLRGFGATQWDFAVHRDFPIRESLRLEFRAEFFNILNHPNFAQPIGDLSGSPFGQSTQMLGRSFDRNTGGGSFSALYQVGGPRSIQFALKLTF